MNESGRPTAPDDVDRRLINALQGGFPLAREPYREVARQLGLDEADRKLLRTLIEKFNGGPAGVETLAATMREDRETIEDVYEPFLLQEGLLERTSRGRVATRRAYEHLGKRLPHGLF